jgi:maltooligosyltrehalose trehalohydrolase
VFGVARRGSVDGSVLGAEAFVLRYFAHDDHTGDRLLIVNLGRDLNPEIVPDPLLAPPDGCAWSVELSTEAARYGGGGTGPVETDDGWRIPGHAALVLRPGPRPPTPAAPEPSP